MQEARRLPSPRVRASLLLGERTEGNELRIEEGQLLRTKSLHGRFLFAAQARAMKRAQKGRAAGYVVFDTSIGPCGIVWSERGIKGLQLPESTKDATHERVRVRFSVAEEGPLPAFVRQAVTSITNLLEGAAVDLRDIELDMEGIPPFHQKVYAVARSIGPGKTASYGEVAARAGSPGAARAVGQAMGKNPFAIIVPCHRVLASGGKLGGFSAPGGADTKRRMLAIEATSAGE